MNRTYEAVGNSKIPKCHPIIDAEIMKLHENDEVISDQIVHLRKKGQPSLIPPNTDS